MTLAELRAARRPIRDKITEGAYDKHAALPRGRPSRRGERRHADPLSVFVHRQLDAISQRIDRLKNRVNTVDADVKLLTGKVYELMSRSS